MLAAPVSGFNRLDFSLTNNILVSAEHHRTKNQAVSPSAQRTQQQLPSLATVAKALRTMHYVVVSIWSTRRGETLAERGPRSIAGS